MYSLLSVKYGERVDFVASDCGRPERTRHHYVPWGTVVCVVGAECTGEGVVLKHGKPPTCWGRNDEQFNPAGVDSLMDDPAVTAKQLVDLARKHIEDQQNRIVRQRELMAKYERDDDLVRLSKARRILEKMQNQLAQMTAAHVAAEEHWATLTVDEASVEKVMRDTPM
jgi:hypothetical protein